MPFPVLLSTLIRSRFQAKPATLLIPIDFSFLFTVEELYGTRYQSGSFSLINVGSGFHCLRSFFLLELLLYTHRKNQLCNLISCIPPKALTFSSPCQKGVQIRTFTPNPWTFTELSPILLQTANTTLSRIATCCTGTTAMGTCLLDLHKQALQPSGEPYNTTSQFSCSCYHGMCGC